MLHFKSERINVMISLTTQLPEITSEGIIEHALLRFNAHEHAYRQRKVLEESDGCACFYCFEHFSPAEITTWVDHDDTAICPHCGMDSVIGSASGFPLTNGVLRKMYDRTY
jgi:hypothetical protein